MCVKHDGGERVCGWSAEENVKAGGVSGWSPVGKAALSFPHFLNVSFVLQFCLLRLQL